MGVQAHVLVLRRDLEQREHDDQDEDEAYLTNPDFQLIKNVNLTKLFILISLICFCSTLI